MKSLFFLVIALMLTSCLEGNNEDAASENRSFEQDAPMIRTVSGDNSFSKGGFSAELATKSKDEIQISANDSKMLIKNGSIEIEVKDIYSAKAKLDELIAPISGYYANEVLNKSDYRFDYNLTVRVPSKYFDSFVESISKTGGTVTRQDINSRDVTAEFIDLELRHKNKMAYIERYREILKQAKNVQEIMEVEEKIRVIEEEIESVKGTMKYLSDQASFSTLNINYYQINIVSLKPPDGYFSRLWSSVKKGWTAISEFSLIIVMLWPFFIIGIVIFIIIYKISKKSVSRKK